MRDCRLATPPRNFKAASATVGSSAVLTTRARLLAAKEAGRTHALARRHNSVLLYNLI